MILLINTSSPTTLFYVVDGGKTNEYQYQADRTLAKNMLSYVKEILDSNQSDWSSVDGIGVYKGPGSFTGLRIGLTVANTLANAMQIPIVGGTGDDWREAVVSRLKSGDDEQAVLPFYGSVAHITLPKK